MVSPAMDLIDHLNNKKSAQQITPHCFCEQLTTVILSECHSGSHTSNQSVFDWLSATPIIKQAKRHHCHRKSTFFDEEYSKVIANITRHDLGKQQIVKPGNSDAGFVTIYWPIPSHAGIMPPVDYKALSRVWNQVELTQPTHNHWIQTLLKRDKCLHIWRALQKR